MFKYKLTYSDGKINYKIFATEREANWFIRNEGDHLIKVELIWDE